MGSGGRREGSGRKPRFQSSDYSASTTVPADHREQFKTFIDLIDELLAQGFTHEQIKQILDSPKRK